MIFIALFIQRDCALMEKEFLAQTDGHQQMGTEGTLLKLLKLFIQVKNELWSRFTIGLRQKHPHLHPNPVKPLWQGSGFGSASVGSCAMFRRKRTPKSTRMMTTGLKKDVCWIIIITLSFYSSSVFDWNLNQKSSYWERVTLNNKRHTLLVAFMTRMTPQLNWVFPNSIATA